MTFSQFLSILRARWRIALIVFSVIVGLTVILSLVVSKTYSAVASVVVDVKPDPLSMLASQMGGNTGLMATQVDIIQSDRVARRVVRVLKLTENPDIRRQWAEQTNSQGDIETWVIRLFRKQLEVKPSRESNVIGIGYEAPDPRFAAGVANAFAQAYIDTVLELRVDPAKQFNSFFDARAKEARETLEQAQAKLSAFQQEKGVVMTDERLDIENQRLNELSSQLVILQSMAAEATSRQSQANAGAADKMQEITNNPVVSSLTADLSRQEARLQEISARLGDRNPQVVELKASIGELRQRIDSEVKRLSAGVGISGNISRQREAQTRAELDAQRNKVLRLKQVRDEGTLIFRDVENAQRTYDQIVQRANQSSLESQATASNVSLLSPAVPAIEHSSPKLVLNTLVAVFLGLVLAMGTVLLLEMFDRRIRTPDDIVSALGLPVLGVMPKPGGKASRGHSIPLLQQRLLKPLPQPAKGS